MKRISIAYSLLLTGFLLGINEGRIALWKYEDPHPFAVFPYYAGLLPQDLQDNLKNGIQFDDENQIVEILRDYLP